jgi:hypothetical protein
MWAVAPKEKKECLFHSVDICHYDAIILTGDTWQMECRQSFCGEDRHAYACLIVAQYGECVYPGEVLLSLASVKFDKLDTNSEVQTYGKLTA